MSLSTKLCVLFVCLFVFFTSDIWGFSPKTPHHTERVMKRDEDLGQGDKQWPQSTGALPATACRGQHTPTNHIQQRLFTWTVKRISARSLKSANKSSNKTYKYDSFTLQNWETARFLLFQPVQLDTVGSHVWSTAATLSYAKLIFNK